MSQLRELLSLILPLLGSLTAGMILAKRHNKSRAECEGKRQPKDFRKDDMVGRIEAIQYDGNDPIEDRVNAYQLKNFPGYYAAVFDGHGGW